VNTSESRSEVLKCGAGVGERRSVGSIVWKMEELWRKRIS